MIKSEKDRLKETISLLEDKQAVELKLLKEQFHLTYESVKPFNLIKSTLHEVTSSPDIKENILNNVIGLTTGYLSKKVVVGGSHNSMRKLFGTLLQFTITNIVANYAGVIKTTGRNLLQSFRRRNRAEILK
jgi:hypothetical protein